MTAVAIGGRLSPQVERLWWRYFPGYTDQAFAQHVTSLVRPDDVVLEVGAGSGLGLQAAFPLRGRCRRYVGIDVDPRVLGNPHLDEGVVADATALPFGDGEFDLVFHKMVAEHLEDPGRTLREIARVLKPGGRIVFETVSRFHYPMLLAQVTPDWVHRLLVAKLGSGRVSEDVFPTLYRLNSRRAIARAARAAGLAAHVEFRRMPPGYLRFSRVAFMAGVLYGRTVERAFPALRQIIWATLTKPPR